VSGAGPELSPGGAVDVDASEGCIIRVRVTRLDIERTTEAQVADQLVRCSSGDDSCACYTERNAPSGMLWGTA